MGLKVYVVVKPPQSNAIHLMKQTIAQILTQKNTEIQRHIHKHFSRSNAIRLMKQSIAQILTQIQTKIRGQIQRSRVSLLFETGLQAT